VKERERERKRKREREKEKERERERELLPDAIATTLIATFEEIPKKLPYCAIELRRMEIAPSIES
jgi:hypothetical protein